MVNPYLNKSKGASSAPFILRVSMHDFKSAEDMEAELELEELCIGRIPNVSQPFGYTHHTALVYKSVEGEVFSLTLAQHSGEMKPGTLESYKKVEAQETKKDSFPQGKLFGKNKRKKRKA